MATAYCTSADLAARIGADVLLAVGDDNNDGTADAPVIAAVIRDASAIVDSYYFAAYDVPVPDPVPTNILRLTIDVAEALLYKRRPAYTRGDWPELWKVAIGELEKLRTRKTHLGAQETPEPSPLDGGFVSDSTQPEYKKFFGNMGDF